MQLTLRVQGPKKRWPAILSGEETANMAAKHYGKVEQHYYETGQLPDDPPEAKDVKPEKLTQPIAVIS